MTRVLGKIVVLPAAALLVMAGSALAQQPKAPAKTPAKAAATRAQTAKVSAPTRRDPFEPLVSRQRGTAIPENLPPGPAGLVVASLRVDGVVRSPSGMLAVVTSPQNRVYFVREGQRLYDGAVERINMDSVVFRESGRDPFGKPVQRQVVKRIYARAGE
jgi:Tfp pilus assembly protein PilP